MMTARAWPLCGEPGWRRNRHDHHKGHACSAIRASVACRPTEPPSTMTLPTPWVACRGKPSKSSTARLRVGSLQGLRGVERGAVLPGPAGVPLDRDGRVALLQHRPDRRDQVGQPGAGGQPGHGPQHRGGQAAALVAREDLGGQRAQRRRCPARRPQGEPGREGGVDAGAEPASVPSQTTGIVWPSASTCPSPGSYSTNCHRGKISYSWSQYWPSTSPCRLYSGHTSDDSPAMASHSSGRSL